MTSNASTKSVLLSGAALLFIATAAVAGSGVGGVFNLGQVNTVSGVTKLQGSTTTQQLYVQNVATTGDATGILGVSTRGAGLWGHTNSRIGVRASTGATAGVNYGVYATTGSPDGYAGYFQSATASGSNGTALVALSKGQLSDIPNRYARSAGAFIGINGVMGLASTDSTNGIGLIGLSSGTSGAGVRAASSGQTGPNYGIWASTSSLDGQAGLFQNTGTREIPLRGVAVRGIAAGATAENLADRGGYSAGGEFVGPYGVVGVGIPTLIGASGVAGYTKADSGNGVGGVASGPQGIGIYGAGTLYALYAKGNAVITGTLTKGSGTFKIDHPLDPENKYLSHSFVESPDMMNIYNGNIVTDAEGEATVDLPSYFEALNRDPRYQLTVIGSFASAQIAQEISDNRFVIRTSEPNVKVSWQVTGIRQDAFALAHPVAVEEEKAVADRGHYLHPVELGQPASLAIGREMQMAQQK